MVREGIVLGHLVSSKGLEVDKAKVEVIQDLALPKSIRELRSFLGHVGFYRRFTQDFPKVSKPWTSLICKEKDFIIDEEGNGGVRPRSPPRHDTTAPDEPFCARGSIRLSLLLYFFIMDLLTRTCLSGSSFISSLPLGSRVGSSLFGIPFVKPILLYEPFILFL